MLRLTCWNMHGLDLWQHLRETETDIGLLQEARIPGLDVRFPVVPTKDEPWRTAGFQVRAWGTALAAVSPRFELRPRPVPGLDTSAEGQLWCSRPGTITVADVVRDGEAVLTVASVYASWERAVDSGEIFADASAHRVLSDLSPLITNRKGHRLIVAGDFNLLYGYGEHGSSYWRDRYATVFDRAGAMGLVFMGPQAPNGRQADPHPSELPEGSLNVPTYHHNRQTAETATRQMDFVFASESIVDRVSTRAMNGIDEWGPSDHCRVMIEVNL